MQTKSPFVVIEEFLSPLECEDFIRRQNDTMPNVDERNCPIKSVRENKLSEIRILPKLRDLIPQLEEYYGFEYFGTQTLNFEWYPEGCQDDKPHCENSHFFKGKWSRMNDKDFCGIIFLNEYNPQPPFDDSFEVLGGKLSFPNHDFSFNPRRGTLVIFPGEQHFINLTTGSVVGDNHQIRFHITATKPWEYDSKKFKGTYEDWFSA